MFRQCLKPTLKSQFTKIRFNSSLNTKTPSNTQILKQQQAFLTVIQYNDTQRLQKVIAQAEESLGDKIPLTASILGMKSLLQSKHFSNLVESQVKLLHKFLVLKHPLVSVVKTILSNTAPNIHPNSKKHPIPLPFRSLVISLLGSVYGRSYRSTRKLAEINGLIEAGINIHRNIPKSTFDVSLKSKILKLNSKNQKFASQITKLAVLGGDFLLAKASHLVCTLNEPLAVDKISCTIADISESSGMNEDHSDQLLQACCECIVIVEQGSNEDLYHISSFCNSLGKAYKGLLDCDYKVAIENKNICLSSLNKLNTTRVNKETEYNRDLLRNLVEAFLPVEQSKVDNTESS